MSVRDLPSLPGVDPATAPTPDDPGYCDWIEQVVFSHEGVDCGLIWDALHRTPSERLRSLQEMVDTLRIGDHGDDPVR